MSALPSIQAAPLERAAMNTLLWRAAVAGLLLAAITTGNGMVQHAYGSLDRAGRIAVGNLIYWGLWWPFVPVLAQVVRRGKLVFGAAAVVLLMMVHSMLLLALQRLFHLTDWYTGRLLPDAFAIVYWRFFEDIPALAVFAGVVFVSDEAVRRQRLSLQLVEARLENLRNQLNPHFLFNALNALAMLIRIGDNTTAVRMLTGVSGILQRLLVDKRAGLIPLEEELAFLRQYLDVEKLRFGDRLAISLDVDARARHELVPAVMLQPLVENAVRHSVENNDAGRVDVQIEREPNTLHIRISNNGRNTPHLGGSGTGLSNVKERLAALFGDRASLVLRHEAEHTVADLRLPCAS